jgi:hypothetical protein
MTPTLWTNATAQSTLTVTAYTNTNSATAEWGREVPNFRTQAREWYSRYEEARRDVSVQRVEGGAPLATQFEQERAARAELRRTAAERAKLLLLSVLNETQRTQFNERGFFTVVGSRGGIYEIHTGRTHNIYKVDARGRRLEEWCVHVESDIPDYDNMVAQKLELETNEDGLRRLANVWSLPNHLMIHHAERQARHVPGLSLEEMLRQAA